MIDIRVSQMCSTDTSYSSLSARIFGVYHSLINPRRPLNKRCTKCSDFRLKFKEKSYLSNALMNSDIELHSSKVDDASFSRVYGIWHKHPLSAVRWKGRTRYSKSVCRVCPDLKTLIVLTLYWTNAKSGRVRNSNDSALHLKFNYYTFCFRDV